MSCTITILSVIPHGVTGQPVSSVTVSGSATACNGVVVRISCGALELTVSVSVSAQGTWQAIFANLGDQLCRCGDPNSSLTVLAYCKDNPDCSDRHVLHPIQCQPYPCPTIIAINAQIPTCDQVNLEGGWNVAFSASINGQGVTNYVWTFGDGQTLSGPNLQQVTHLYHCAGTYPVTLVILSDCQIGYVHVLTTTVTLQPCGCPTITITAQQDVNTACKWSFKASVSGPFVQCIERFLWNFGDGTQVETQTPAAEHTYSGDGTKTVTLTLLGALGQTQGGSCYTTKQIMVENCGGNGNGDGRNPCPWWNPFCGGFSLCALFLAIAVAAILAAGPLLMTGWCTGVHALIVAGTAAAVVGLAFLGLWYAACRHHNKSFCHAINDLICIVTYIQAAQTIVVLIMMLTGNMTTPCGTGALLTWGYYGTVLTTLLYMRGAANCRQANCLGEDI